MIVADLIKVNEENMFNSALFSGRLIAKDGGSGKEVFDTEKNRLEYVQKFYGCKIELLMCCGKVRDLSYENSWWQPSLLCYLDSYDVKRCKDK